MPFKTSTLLAFFLCLQWHGISATPLESRDDLSAPSQVLNFVIEGCYTASSLSVQLGNNANMTIESCVSTCSTAGFIRAGLVAGTQCWCGNVIKPGNHLVPITSCSSACAGNPGEMCGGDSSMLEYSVRPEVIPQQVTTVKATWYAIFCVRDDTNLRTLHHLQEASDLMTVERCIDACDAGEFSIAGVEYGRECWCGNADMYGRTGNTPVPGCNMPCAGNPTELCGGPSLLNLYANQFRSVSVGPPNPARGPIKSSNGETWNGGNCVLDNAPSNGGQRTLPHRPSNPIPVEKMTPFLCIDRCAADGWNTAGVEYSQECWCGNGPIPSNLQAPDGDCNMACTDYADFTCGGPNRLTVYSTS